MANFLAVSVAIALITFFSIPGARGRDFIIATAVSLGFAIAAWILRGVTAYGALAGAAVAFEFYRTGGWRLFAVLFCVFVLTLLATKIAGKRREPRGRSAAQVMANLLAPAFLLLFYGPVVKAMAMAALAELTADTVSSELGEAFGGQAYLIDSLLVVQPGTNGGVSLVGSISGGTAAILIAVIASMFGQMSFAMMGIVALAGVLGMFVDSFLGATLENRGWLNNEAVNLLSTFSAAVIAWALIRFIPI